VQREMNTFAGIGSGECEMRTRATSQIKPPFIVSKYST
jgi:hypothetical protein